MRVARELAIFLSLDSGFCRHQDLFNRISQIQVVGKFTDVVDEYQQIERLFVGLHALSVAGFAVQPGLRLEEASVYTSLS